METIWRAEGMSMGSRMDSLMGSEAVSALCDGEAHWASMCWMSTASSSDMVNGVLRRRIPHDGALSCLNPAWFKPSWEDSLFPSYSNFKGYRNSSRRPGSRRGFLVSVGNGHVGIRTTRPAGLSSRWKFYHQRL